MTDTDDLTWYIHLNVDAMKVGDLYTLMRALSMVTDDADFGLDKKEDYIALDDEFDALTLWLCEIEGRFMPAVMSLLCQVRNDVKVREIFHSATKPIFKIAADNAVYGGNIDNLLYKYNRQLAELDGMINDAWRKFEADSGFLQFVAEVYDNDD